MTNKIPQEYLDHPCFGFFNRDQCTECKIHTSCIDQQIYNGLKVLLIKKELDNASQDTRDSLVGYNVSNTEAVKAEVKDPFIDVILPNGWNKGLKDIMIITYGDADYKAANGKTYHFNHEDLSKIIKVFGGKVSSTIGVKSTDNMLFLKCSAQSTSSPKEEMARNAGISIIDETEFFDTLIALCDVPSNEELMGFIAKLCS